MYKVVIIDDEPIIVEGIKRSIHWEKFKCEVVGTAYNGQEGINIIRKTKPDILVSDINMSCMDGLTMIAAIKSEFPYLQVTILTGYRDFDYAQKAIRLGVTRFLLKPSKLNELEEAIYAMIEQLKVHKKMYAYASGNEALPESVNMELSATSEQDENNEANNFIVRNALDYIEEHFNSKLKLSDVADKIYVSQWHLSKLLNKHTGQNFSEILNKVRIDKAKTLLEDPSLRIGDIAEHVGFMDIAHFSRVFKKIVGISANEYRNKVTGR